MPLSHRERFAPLSPGAAAHDAPLSEPQTRALGGDGAVAFLDIAFRSHGSALMRFLARKVGQEEANDLLQETFLRAAGSRHGGAILHPAAFLRRVALNLLIDRSRRRVREEAVFVPLLEEHDAPVAGAQEEELAAAALLRRYEAVVEAMPPQMRRVFLMSRVDELPHRAIAAELGISRSAVEQHMTKALKRLMAVRDEAA